ncbi:protein Niban 1-like [Polymixia lowei]
MGGRHTHHLNSRQRRYITEHIAGIVEDLAPLYQRHYSSNLLGRLRNKHIEPAAPRPLILRPDAFPHGEILLEGTLPHYLDGTWRHCHLQVTNRFTVESRNAKEVFRGGWGCKKELILSGCQICTSIQEHCALLENMCKHITGKSGGKMAFWDCPTEFPVFIQHPYSAPVCLATASHQEQTQWANILKAAIQHQSSALWCEASLESQAFLDAVSSLKKLRGGYQRGVLPMGNEEEVLASMLMEEVMSYLREQVFPRICGLHSRTTQAWIRLLSEVYQVAGDQIKAALPILKEKLSHCHSHLEKQISPGLQQASLLQDHIAHSITEDIWGRMLESLLHVITPRLDRTLQEVATPICDGFASTRRYFLETCDDIIDQGPKCTSIKEVLRPLSDLGLREARTWQCLARLEMGSEGQAWLQETWGVHSRTWRPLALKVQNALYKVVNKCAVMFRRLLSQYSSFSLDQSQLSAVLYRIRDKVVKVCDWLCLEKCM